MVNLKEMRDEISLQEGECCIVFDLSCYYPYANQDEVVFDFSFGGEEFCDYKKNHRYPNQGYKTISKQYDRNVSKVGYPYIMRLENQREMLLCVKVGFKGKEIASISFPVQTSMTSECPYCVVSLKYTLEKGAFTICSVEELKRGCCNVRRWVSDESIAKEEFGTVMRGRRLKGSKNVVYDTIITPYALPKKGF